MASVIEGIGKPVPAGRVRFPGADLAQDALRIDGLPHPDLVLRPSIGEAFPVNLAHNDGIFRLCRRCFFGHAL